MKPGDIVKIDGKVFVVEYQEYAEGVEKILLVYRKEADIYVAKEALDELANYKLEKVED